MRNHVNVAQISMQEALHGLIRRWGNRVLRDSRHAGI
jgi:phage tail sheath protein FI